MKRILAAFLLLALVAGGCGGRGADEELPEPGATGGDYRLQEDIVFLVDSARSPVLLTAAEHFVQVVSDLTGGELEVSVRATPGAGARYGAGGAQFVFLDSAEDAEQCAHFSAVSLPFLYKDYDSFTMTVNDSAVLDMIAGGLSRPGRALGGFYRLGNQLVTVWQAENYQPFDGAVVALDYRSDTQIYFNALDADVVHLSTLEERVDWLRRDLVQGVEMTLEEVAATDWTGTFYYLTITHHDIDPVWLVAEESFFSGLSPTHQAAVREAVTYLFADIDGYYLDREEMLLARIGSMDLLVSRDFSKVRNRIFYILEEFPNSPVGEAERLLLDLVNNFN